VPPLLDALRAAPDDGPAWNFTLEPNHAAWWRRRQAHETAVHRWDGQLAHGTPDPIEAAVAADGVDEALSVMWVTAVAMGRATAPSGSLHVHLTDVPGEWLCTVSDGKIAVEREHAKGDAALRGAASDVIVFLWGRGDANALEIIGDASVVDQWRLRF
jgi:hypothetical protein